MNTLDDLSGKEFGIWKVLEFDHMEQYGVNKRHGMSYYKCKCMKCGMVLLVPRSHLTHGKCSRHNGCKDRKV